MPDQVRHDVRTYTRAVLATPGITRHPGASRDPHIHMEDGFTRQGKRSGSAQAVLLDAIQQRIAGQAKQSRGA